MNVRTSRRFTPKNVTFMVVAAGFAAYLFFLLRSHGIPRPRDIIIAIFYFLLLDWGRIPERIRLLLFDGVLFFGGMLVWLGFFAQFILPLRRLRDRYAALDRLVVYLAGQSGPTVFVKNGKKQERKGEQYRKGPGLYVLDSASAGVIRNDVQFKEAVGPGVVFTRKGDYLADPVVDLRRQALPIPPLGPRFHQDPFAPGDAGDPEYQEAQERRQQTAALTRDGVEIVPNVLVVFEVERPENEEENKFGFNPKAVLDWVTYKGKQSPADQEVPVDSVPFEYLPAYVAVDVWREYAQKVTLQELFTYSTNANGARETRLAFILRMVRDRLSKAQVDVLDANGRPIGTKRPSAEYALLHKRGIHVIAVNINNFRFRATVEKKLVDDWTATWLQRAEAERARVERKRNLAALEARNQALLRYVLAAAEKFDDRTLNLPPPAASAQRTARMKDAGDRLVRGTITLCFSDAELAQNLKTETGEMTDLVSWIRIQ